MSCINPCSRVHTCDPPSQASVTADAIATAIATASATAVASAKAAAEAVAQACAEATAKAIANVQVRKQLAFASLGHSSLVDHTSHLIVNVTTPREILESNIRNCIKFPML